MPCFFFSFFWLFTVFTLFLSISFYCRFSTGLGASRFFTDPQFLNLFFVSIFEFPVDFLPIFNQNDNNGPPQYRGYWIWHKVRISGQISDKVWKVSKLVGNRWRGPWLLSPTIGGSTGAPSARKNPAQRLVHDRDFSSGLREWENPLPPLALPFCARVPFPLASTSGSTMFTSRKCAISKNQAVFFFTWPGYFRQIIYSIFIYDKKSKDDQIHSNVISFSLRFSVAFLVDSQFLTTLFLFVIFFYFSSMKITQRLE